MARTAAALVIGNEILTGKRTDTNSPFLARELRALGIDLRRILVVPDEVGEIAGAVRDLAPRHDHVFTSGGVGPTHDDVTLEAIASALGRPLEREPEMERLIRQFHDVERTPHALRMADLPAGTELIWGEGLRVPVVAVENLFVLPGVPSIFERKVKALRERLRDDPYHLREVHVRHGEVEIAAALYDLVAAHPGLMVGSYPELGAPFERVRVTLESKDERLVARALGELLAALPAGAVEPD